MLKSRRSARRHQECLSGQETASRRSTSFVGARPDRRAGIRCKVASLELQFRFAAEEAEALPGNEVEAEAGLRENIGLLARAAIGDAAAGIGEEQGLLGEAPIRHRRKAA